jgi:putative membrane-bound dehydrogenase-like protein
MLAALVRGEVMRPRVWFGLGMFLLIGAAETFAADAALGLHVPPGFEVTEFADSRLANNIYHLTLDPKGRVVVAGPGYIRILVDDDNDGRADRALDFADGPMDGAQGMLWEGNWLYVSGDGGLRRYRVAAGGDRADGPSELIRALKTGGEHSAHAIRRGPDGWLYLLCGKSTGVDATFAQLPTSPIRNPVAGCVLRFRPDLKASEIVADGFRNPYDMDFNSQGELFTFDSDNERCVSLPWYAGTRFYHVIPGGHYGWQNPQRAETWRMPPYFPDVVAPVMDLGRGSPTGVACYRHVQFPESYHGGFFLLDWTFGRVYFLKLKPAGSTYTAEKQLFLEATGDNGFAPTAIAVHPVTGDLYISIGGRGTRGAVYRIRYPDRLKSVNPDAVARLKVRPQSLDWQPPKRDELLKNALANGAPAQRLQALNAIRRHRDCFQSKEICQVVRASGDDEDRFVRQAAASLIATLDRASRWELIVASTPRQIVTLGLANFASDPNDVLSRATGLLAVRKNGPDVRLESVRLMQLVLGELTAVQSKGSVWEGYSLRENLNASLGTRIDRSAFIDARTTLRAAFPTGHPNLDREITRTLAAIEDDAVAALREVAERLTPESDPVEDIHYLIVLARLRARREAALTTVAGRTVSVTRRVAGALLDLDRKFTQRRLNRDRNWPLRLGEVYAELARKDPALHDAVLAHADFGRPDHALFARAPGFNRRRAAEKFLEKAESESGFAWNAPLVEILGSLPVEKYLPVLRKLSGQAGLDDAILPLLARQPQPADREKFLEGLNSPKLAGIRLCLDALDKLPPVSDGPTVIALLRSLRSLPDGKEENQLQDRLIQTLKRITGQKMPGGKQAWTDWFSAKYPDLAARLGNADGVDVSAWNQRLAKVDWLVGDPERGKGLFVKANCSSCHSGTQALGPDLRGVAGRFSRDDVFTAILQPSKDIAPRYRTTLIATENGKVYQGLIIYEAVDSLILQTGPAVTVRIPVDQIASRRISPISLMPAGLLDKLTDREIADLYAYLKQGLGEALRGK